MAFRNHQRQCLSRRHANMDLGQEFRLFCLALRRPQSSADLQEMQRLAAEIERWNVIVRGARRHRLASAVLAGLKACASPHLPASVVADLHRLSVADARRSLAQIAEVGRLGRLFAEAGIRVLVLKGVALSAQLYGEPGRRAARDIDLLVDPDQLPLAQAVMLAAGYRQRRVFKSHRQYAAYLHAIKELEYVHAVTGELVELHHRAFGNPNLLSIAFSSLWNEREQVSLGDARVFTLPRPRLPLYLCAHGLDHCWARLHWLVDFATAVQQSECMQAAVEAADGCGLGPAFLHALALAHGWLGAPIEQRFLDSYRHSARAQSLSWLLGRLYTTSEWHDLAPKRDLRFSLWERVYRFLLKSDWRYRAGQVQADWFCPADWNAVSLPRTLIWLYPLVRPWGWLLRR